MEFMTEDEALKTWCPKSVGIEDGLNKDGDENVGINRQTKSYDNAPIWWPKECGCLASRCQIWVRESSGASGLGGARRGRCGLVRDDDRSTAALEKIAGILEKLASRGDMKP